VAPGDGLSERQRERIDRAVGLAERSTGLTFAVWVGAAGPGLRERAEELHAATGPSPAEAVLVAVDPAARRLEIVTGRAAKRRLDDRSCELAALTMTSCFAGGDLVGGIEQGLASLADHAQAPAILHLDQP
jgi:hypothetical protein